MGGLSEERPKKGTGEETWREKANNRDQWKQITKVAIQQWRMTSLLQKGNERRNNSIQLKYMKITDSRETPTRAQIVPLSWEPTGSTIPIKKLALEVI